MAEDFVVPGNKSVYHARKFLNQARQKLRKENYFEALESFNKSLCFAEADSDEFSAALESRLKVIHEIREKQAASEFAPRAAREDADLENFFELSYPPHKNLPFVANCLELKSDENFGRFITATHDLIPGDILAIEEPFFKIVDRAAFHLRCANCLKSNHMILLPSNLTSSAMFCSTKCADEAKEIFHETEVSLRCIEFTQKILLEALAICNGSFEMLSFLVSDPATAAKTVFDFDWNEMKEWKRKLHGLLAFNALQLGPIDDDLKSLEFHPVLSLFQDEYERNIAKAFMERASRIMAVNSFSLEWWSPKAANRNFEDLPASNKLKIGSAMLLFGSLFNHSCAPNIDRMVVGNKFVFICKRPIRAGDQCFISYGPTFIREPDESRQLKLKSSFRFDCSCEACEGSYPLSFYETMNKEVFISNELVKPLKKWIEEFKRNCRTIEENKQKFPCRTLTEVMDRNLYLLAAIARNEPFPF